MNSNSSQNKVWITLAILIIIIPAAIWYLQEQSATSDSKMLNAHIETSKIQEHKKQSSETTKHELKQLDIGKLDELVSSIIAEQTPEGKEWVFGIAVTDPLTGQKYVKNENEVFDAASTAKVPILATLYEQITAKKISEDEKVTITDSDIEDYGTGTIRYKKTPITYTVRELAELMIKQSDNTAASVLATKVGRKNLAEYVKRIGMNNTNIPENTTTPADLNIMLSHIFSMKNTDPQVAGTILNIMTDSAFEARLPAMLPKDVIIAHKIGTGVAQIHDVGIVLLSNRPYIISVFTKKINDEKQAERTISLISKAVYEEFKSLEQ